MHSLLEAMCTQVAKSVKDSVAHCLRALDQRVFHLLAFMRNIHC
jgi:hypothetical protein